MRKHVVAIVLTFILGVVIGAAAAVRAQGQQSTITTDTTGKIIKDSRKAIEPADVKLFIVGERQGRVVGSLKANVKGQWVDVQLDSYNALAGH
jgi:hypothetical protein